MDLSQLPAILQATQTPDNTTRTQAEAALDSVRRVGSQLPWQGALMLLHQLRSVPGFASGLLHAVTNTGISSAGRLMATLTLQKVAMNRWDIEEGSQGALAASDKATVRQNVLQVRAAPHDPSRAQFDRNANVSAICARRRSTSPFPSRRC